MTSRLTIQKATHAGKNFFLKKQKNARCWTIVAGIWKSERCKDTQILESSSRAFPRVIYSYLQKSASIQPRASRSKFADTYSLPPFRPRVKYRSGEYSSLTQHLLNNEERRVMVDQRHVVTLIVNHGKNGLYEWLERLCLYTFEFYVLWVSSMAESPSQLASQSTSRKCKQPQKQSSSLRTQHGT